MPIQTTNEFVRVLSILQRIESESRDYVPSQEEAELIAEFNNPGSALVQVIARGIDELKGPGRKNVDPTSFIATRAAYFQGPAGSSPTTQSTISPPVEGAQCRKNSPRAKLSSTISRSANAHPYNTRNRTKHKEEDSHVVRDSHSQCKWAGCSSVLENSTTCITQHLREVHGQDVKKSASGEEMECEWTDCQSKLTALYIVPHIRSRHLRLNDIFCRLCPHPTILVGTSTLKRHIRTQHPECEE
ncbi:hypothetical protein GALMADRAFT_144294 [Galerina marginata CBS 339.88]|uniref:C2H2-type domain-containing protein n=1 Tax=Galerina marginata (strain CBS 339.88) TaxID=685588 RepID=A0A067SIN1_GALM3|nr:hypothetical protein GALMADRAFT_144294 [Galerina marginata CBS 339.88]